MQIMTFEEWRKENSDIEDGMRSERHPCGLIFGFLADRGAEDAGADISARMYGLYQERVTQDQENLNAWNEAVKSVNHGGENCEQVTT